MYCGIFSSVSSITLYSPPYCLILATHFCTNAGAFSTPCSQQTQIIFSPGCIATTEDLYSFAYRLRYSYDPFRAPISRISLSGLMKVFLILYQRHTSPRCRNNEISFMRTILSLHDSGIKQVYFLWGVFPVLYNRATGQWSLPI